MPPKWVVEVPQDQLVDGEQYFLAKKIGMGSMMFLSTNIRGEQLWGFLPGAAVHAVCGEQFREILGKNPNRVAVAIPDDHATRWRRIYR